MNTKNENYLKLKGETMKNITILTTIIFAGILSFASGKNPPSSDGYGTPRCAAYDSGSTEEHGSHSTCESCLAGHDNCDMKCYSYTYECTASTDVEVTEIIRDPKTGETQEVTSMKERTFRGSGRTEREAQDRALSECEYQSDRYTGGFVGTITNAPRRGPRDGGRRPYYSRCDIKTCDERANETSTRRCVR